jgi:KUP system potassium uptake protein
MGIHGVPRPGGRSLLPLVIGAIGVVFGDIGTSPLYALRECFNPERGIALTVPNVLGIVSLLLWTLILTVCLKYLVFVLRADNQGEGGILALVALVSRALRDAPARRLSALVFVGILGASLIYADGVITPAVSILSAIEGLENISPAFKPWIIPLAVVVLLALFPLQSRGTGGIGRLFGPAIILWFLVIGLLGFLAIIRNPAILTALNPAAALGFLLGNPRLGFGVLGAVFLAVTGAEVLYADIGHFGATPIRLAWFGLAFPCLLLNYLGQGAFLLGMPAHYDNLFFQLAPDWLLLPLVILATAATIIASQAVISGAFSLARQSVQLGYWPRLRIIHTSRDTVGQVYVPLVNWLLAGGTLALILGFRESARLADAYGIAVSATMLLTTGLVLVLARRVWKIHLVLLVVLGLAFATIDLGFFLSNATKLLTGGWIVALISLLLFASMTTWLAGRRILQTRMDRNPLPLGDFLASMAAHPPLRVAGTAVFLSGNPNGTPLALLHNLKHNSVLHRQVVILSVRTVETPKVAPDARLDIEHPGPDVWRIVASFGFSETPDLPAILAGSPIPGLAWNPMDTTWFLGKENLIGGGPARMAGWRKHLFIFMAHNALEASRFYCLPANRFITIGAVSEF